MLIRPSNQILCPSVKKIVFYSPWTSSTTGSTGTSSTIQQLVANSDDNNDNNNGNRHETTTPSVVVPMVELRQKLMVAEEVYLYKIPPLQTSGGHRAEHWNLAAPIATCALLVERRGDCLTLEFRQTNQTNNDDSNSTPQPVHNQQHISNSNIVSPIFAQAVIDCSIQASSSSSSSSSSSNIDTTDRAVTNESSEKPPPPPPPPQQQQQQPPRQIQHWIEGTVDSSRYFTLRISKDGREALIGFGFRDRDQAIDLRESLQFYEASMRRECEAVALSTTNGNAESKYTIPKLADGERIHVRTGRSSSKDTTATTKAKKTDDSPNRTTKHPILLKKPPPSASSDTMFDDDPTSQLRNGDLENQCKISTTTTTLQDEHQNDKDDVDDDDWDAEFVSAN